MSIKAIPMSADPAIQAKPVRSCREVGKILGISQQAVSYHEHRALEKLRAEWERLGFPTEARQQEVA